MRIGHVIGKVTCSIYEEPLKGSRWLVVNPIDTDQFNTCISKGPALTTTPSLVVYDNLGAREGDIIGFAEGAESTANFTGPCPIDAFNLAIFDSLNYTPTEN